MTGKPRISRTSLAAALAAVFALWTSPGVGARQPRRACRDACDAAIAACTAHGYRKAFCTREILALCQDGHPGCTGLPTIPPCLPTTTTTVPGAGTTTTTLPTTADCLGVAGCTADPTGVSDTVASADELRTRLIGTWTSCDASPKVPFDAPGIEFTADGEWYFLSLEGSSFVRDTGFGRAGTYEIIDTSLMNGPGHFQLNLHVNTGFTIIAQWSLAAHPQLLFFSFFDASSGQPTGSLFSHLPGAPACEMLNGSASR